MTDLDRLVECVHHASDGGMVICRYEENGESLALVVFSEMANSMCVREGVICGAFQETYDGLKESLDRLHFSEIVSRQLPAVSTGCRLKIVLRARRAHHARMLVLASIDVGSDPRLQGLWDWVGTVLAVDRARSGLSVLD